MRGYLLRLILILMAPVLARAADVDQKKAVEQTKALMTTPAERDKFIHSDKRAKETDDKVSALAGSGQNKEEMYSIASEMLDKIVSESKGDPQKMLDLLHESQKDPKAFYEKYFDESQKARVRGLANDIEKHSPSVPHH